MKVLLLLSGGTDSRRAMDALLAEGHRVFGLCFSGRQKGEVVGACKAARTRGIPLHVREMPWLDETTWNVLALLLRDWAFAFAAFRLARRLRVHAIATGTTRSDLNRWQVRLLFVLFWPAAKLLCRLAKVRVMFPVWTERAETCMTGVSDV